MGEKRGSGYPKAAFSASSSALVVAGIMYEFSMRSLYHDNAVLCICFNLIFHCFSYLKWEENVCLQQREPCNRPVQFSAPCLSLLWTRRKKSTWLLPLLLLLLLGSSWHGWHSQRSSSPTIYSVVVSTVPYLRKYPIAGTDSKSRRTGIGRALELLSIRQLEHLSYEDWET